MLLFLNLSFIGIVANLNRGTMLHALEAVLFVEWDVVFVLGHSLNVEEVLVLFLDALHQLPAIPCP